MIFALLYGSNPHSYAEFFSKLELAEDKIPPANNTIIANIKLIEVKSKIIL